MVPYEDEIITMLKNLDVATCLIRSKQGVPYPKNIFESRINAVSNLTVHQVEGGHHAHMDDPNQTAKILRTFLS